jgi:CDP-diacylglycerol---glycerol-3-phosphate 3-phosphatidyltransferase
MKQVINSLTYFRILAGPLIFFFLLIYIKVEIALVIYFLASISDFLDGYLARKFLLTSQLGEVLDPIADKIFVVFVIISLSLSMNSYYVAFMGCVILSREFWVSALRDFNSRNNKSKLTRVTFASKVKTSLQMVAFGSYLFGYALNAPLIIMISHFILLLAVILTLQTGITYTQSTFD